MDLQRLISEVQARPAIWDQKNTHYHNRDIILRLWGEIAKACDVSSDVAKSKWKHLRDNFRNELKKTYRGKQPCDGIGSGGSPPNLPDHESKWVWFKSLQFLRDQMNSRVIGSSCGHPQNGVAGVGASFQTSLDDSTQIEPQIEPQIDIVEGDEEAHFEDLDGGDSCQSMLTSEEIQQLGLPARKRGKIAGRKRILIDPMDSLEYQQGIDRKRYESILQRRLSGCQDDEDDTYHFLMSVRSPLRSLPLDRQMYVRLKIQEILLNELTALGQNASRSHELGSLQDVKPHRGSVSNNSMHLQNSSPERPTDDNYFS